MLILVVMIRSLKYKLGRDTQNKCPKSVPGDPSMLLAQNSFDKFRKLLKQKKLSDLFGVI